MKRRDNYQERFQEYLDANVHPETARNIGRIVWSSPMGSAEFAMNIVLQMQLDHMRKDEEVAGQAQFEYNLADREGEALPPR
jgi:hypothetical protein